MNEIEPDARKTIPLYTPDPEKIESGWNNGIIIIITWVAFILLYIARSLK